MSSQHDLTKRIEEVLEKAPEQRHSYFQLKYFVLGKEPTMQAQMWQALRELQTRKETIDALELEIEDTRDRLEMVDIDREKTKLQILSQSFTVSLPETLRNQEWSIKSRQFDRQKVALGKTLMKLEQKLQFAWQEARFFYQAFEGLNKVEPIRDYDDLESQKDYWNERIAQHINLKILLQQPLDTDIVQTALSLHDDAPIKVQTVTTLRHIQGQMDKMKEGYIAKLSSTKEDNATQDNES